MRLKNISIVFVLLISISSLIAGGGWPQPKGEGYLKLSQWWIVSDQHYSAEGIIVPNVKSGIFNTSIYGEYGFTDRLTGVLYFPLFSRATSGDIISNITGDIISPGESIKGIGDADVSLKYGISKPGSAVAISITATMGLPLGSSAGGSRSHLQLGDGEFNQMVKLDAGTGWQLGSTPLYTNVSLGFNNRTKGFSDELRYSIELGANLVNKKLWVIGRLGGVKSLDNGTYSGVPNGVSIFANNTEFVSIGAELAYNIKDQWGISVSATGAFGGQLILASPSYSFGAFTKF